MKELEVGKDYISEYGVVVIDRRGADCNRGFEDGDYEHDLFCRTPENWREATESEVIEAFKKHLVYRYGKDWETMKIKERHPSSNTLKPINDGSWDVEIYKECDGWSIWNQNGFLYFNGIWVERLEEPTKSTGWSPSPEDIKEIKAGEEVDKRYALKRDVLTILSVESKLNPDKKISEYLEQFKLILEVL